MVNRLIEPTSGTITLDGEDITHVDPVALRRRMGYVIQQVGLFPHQTIHTNVATVPSLLGWDRKKAMARADKLMDLVGLDPAQHGGRYPHRSRVANASASGWPAPSPPTRRCCSWTSRSARSTRWSGSAAGVPAAAARPAEDGDAGHHDIDEAVRMGDRVAVFAAGGQLAQYDVPAQILGSPADDFVAEFVGSARGCASPSHPDRPRRPGGARRSGCARRWTSPRRWGRACHDDAVRRGRGRRDRGRAHGRCAHPEQQGAPDPAPLGPAGLTGAAPLSR